MIITFFVCMIIKCRMTLGHLMIFKYEMIYWMKYGMYVDLFTIVKLLRKTIVDKSFVNAKKTLVRQIWTVARSSQNLPTAMLTYGRNFINKLTMIWRYACYSWSPRACPVPHLCSFHYSSFSFNKKNNEDKLSQIKSSLVQFFHHSIIVSTCICIYNVLINMYVCTYILSI